MNPTVRGLLVVALIALVVITFNLYVTLAVVYALAGIAFYLGAFTIVFALGAYFVTHPSGLNALAFLLVLGFSGFGMWRVWRDQHTYGY